MIEAIWAWAAHGDLLNQHFARGDGSTIPVALQDRSKRPDAAAAAQAWLLESGSMCRLQPTRRKSAGMLMTRIGPRLARQC